MPSPIRNLFMLCAASLVMSGCKKDKTFYEKLNNDHYVDEYNKLTGKNAAKFTIKENVPTQKHSLETYPGMCRDTAKPTVELKFDFDHFGKVMIIHDMRRDFAWDAFMMARPEIVVPAMHVPFRQNMNVN